MLDIIFYVCDFLHRMTVSETMEVMETDQHEEVETKSDNGKMENGREEGDSDFVNQLCGGRDFLSTAVLLDSKGGHVIISEENRVLVFSAATGQIIR